MASSACLKCGQIIMLGSDLQVGQLFKCNSCRAEFELVWINPIELDWTFEDDDPWDEGFDFEPDFEGHDKYDGWDGI